MAEEKKTPSQFPALESLRFKAREFAAGVSHRSEPPFPAHGTEAGDALLSWMARSGDAQLAASPDDPVERAMAHQRATMRFEQLPGMVRLAAKGLGGEEGARDRMRLAAGSSTHSEFGDAEEMLAAIEARRMVQARGYPKYWSREESEQVDRGLLAMTDRSIAENWGASGEAKAKAAKELGAAIGALGSNCDLMALYCAEELARKGAGPEQSKEIAARQAEILGCAKDMISMPSLQRSLGNVALAGLAGVGMAALAPVLGHAAMPVLQELASHATMLRGVVQAASHVEFSYGMAVSCSALAAAAGSFLGVGWRAPARLDAISDAAAVKQGLGEGDAKVECAKAADDRLRISFEGLSEEMLSRAQITAFVKSLGFARSRVVGTILGGEEVSADSLPGLVGQNLRDMPKSELALIGQIKDPAIAACFLLDTVTRSQRMDLTMLQRRLDFLGSGERGFHPEPEEMEQARKALVMGGGPAARMAAMDPGLSASLGKALSGVTPMGQRFLRLCPKAQRGEFVASLLAKPLDARLPDLDVASRLNDTLKLACAKLERKSFLDKKLSAFISKSTKSLIENPMRALRSWADRAFSSREDQVMDFSRQAKALEAASGGLSAGGWGQSSPAISERMQRATARYRGVHSRLDAIGESPAPALPAESTQDGLTKIAGKLRGAKMAGSAGLAPAAPATARI